MKKQLVRIILFVPAVLLSISSAARQRDSIPELKPLGNVAVALDMSLSGPGISVAVPVHRNISIRASYSFLPLFSHGSDNGDESPSVLLLRKDRAINMFPVSEESALNLHSFMLTADYAPFNNGRSLFYITGGIILQNSRMAWDTEVYDAGILHEFGVTDSQMSDIYVINKNGEYRLGSDSKIEHIMYRPPFGMYLGLGLGRAIPKRRVGFRAEIGLPLYIGKYRVSSEGLEKSFVGGLFNPMFGPSSTISGIFPAFNISFHLTVKLFKENRK